MLNQILMELSKAGGLTAIINVGGRYSNDVCVD